MDNILGQINALGGGAEPSVRGLPIKGPISFHDADGVVVIKGRPRLGGSFGENSAKRLLGAYRSSGWQFLSDIRGPFSVAIFVPSERRLLIAVDRMGVERLAWGRNELRFAFGSSAFEVAKLVTESVSLNPQAFYDFMLGHMVPSPITAFTGISKLGPASAIEVVGGKVSEHRYWQPRFERDTSTTIDDLKREVQPALSKAILRAGPDAASGAFLSGGLDSSTVTGLLSIANAQSSNAFSVGFGVAEFDEMEYATLASNHFGCKHFTYEVSADDIVNTIPEIAKTYDEPFGNSSAVPTLCCARLAKRNGVDHLYAGDGGDEIFAGNERYVRHRIFETYKRIPSALRKNVFEPVANWLDPERSIYPLRKFSSYVRQAQISLPERFESWNLIYREGPERVFSPDFLARIDRQGPVRHMFSIWDDCPSEDLLDHMLWYDWKFVLADSDLRKVSTMCELAGVRVSYPMLDEDVIDLSMRVPTREKISGNELRTFFKSSVRNLLPQKIIDKQKHGFGLPFGQWLKTHDGLQSLVYGSLDELGKRGIFDGEFLGRVAAEHRNGHASYYGYAIWDLVMLEQWLQHHSQGMTESII